MFLPVAGYRYGSTVERVEEAGNYWTATYNSGGLVCHLTIISENVYTDHYGGQRQFGFNVRLVMNVTN